MTEIEKRLLKELYNDPSGDNHIDNILSKKINTDLIEFDKTVKLLERKKYIQENTTDNQRNLSDRSWKITVEGAIAFNEAQNSKGISDLLTISKIAQAIVILVSIVTTFIVFQQYITSKEQNDLVREQNSIMNKEYKLHQEEFKRQNVKIDSLKDNN